MASTRGLAEARRVAGRLHRALGEDIRRLREDTGLTRATLAAAAGLDGTYVARIEDGRSKATIEAYARLARALGADLSARLYPNAGPANRDRHQARMLEWLLGECHARWKRYPEVAVRHPARGWIDLVLHDPVAGSLVATEIESTIRRVEQQIRWAGEKTASLPSWEGFAHLWARL